MAAAAGRKSACVDDDGLDDDDDDDDNLDKNKRRRRSNESSSGNNSAPLTAKKFSIRWRLGHNGVVQGSPIPATVAHYRSVVAERRRASRGVLEVMEEDDANLHQFIIAQTQRDLMKEEEKRIAKIDKEDKAIALAREKLEWQRGLEERERKRE
ncbi:hypothetical protein HK101_002613, partial [Irineochytrium annulatum]